VPPTVPYSLLAVQEASEAVAVPALEAIEPEGAGTQAPALAPLEKPGGQAVEA